jgi:uncharacterized protein DUF5916
VRVKRTAQLVVGLVFLYSRAAAGQPAADTPVLHIPHVTRPPTLESFVDGSPRQAEAVVTTFLQRAPRDGDPVSESTSAYLSYDDRNLYVVFVCKDRHAQIRARLSPRDSIETDDLVGIYLDTFHDRQRAYFFKINPLGVQADEIVTEGQGADPSWDAVWYSRGRLLDDGYVVWAAIPFASLRFSNAEAQAWGVGLTRYIQRNNEDSYWPYITDRVEGLVAHFATMDGLAHVAPAGNVQVIPHAVYTGARLLDTASPGRPSYRTDHDPSSGVDVKMVVKNSFTLDIAANPEFSQVESNDPQVTINQRFEVFFPEKRPFFIENAGFFQTPEALFFSRRIVDPQAGLRLTGKTGRWAVGVLAIDDRAPGENRAPDDPLQGVRAFDAAIRVAREFAGRSTLGVLAVSRDVGGSSNRIVAADTRLILGSTWAVTGQVSGSRSRGRDAGGRSGFAAWIEGTRSGLNFGYTGRYVDRSPDFAADLGFIPRVDIRETTHAAFYFWRPAASRLVSFGPKLVASGNWDRRRRVQDWLAEPTWQMVFIGPTMIGAGMFRSFERFRDLPFDKRGTSVSVSTDVWKRLGLAFTDRRGRGVNYFPSEALARTAAAYPADFSDTSLTVTMKPTAQVRVDEIYFYSRLITPDRRAVFNSHTARTKFNYQFTRAWSLRTIVDYNGVLPNEDLVALEHAKDLTYDLLLTYLLNPGTAVYVGFADRYENLALLSRSSGELTRIASPATSTGRQIFVKVSYLFRRAG